MITRGFPKPFFHIGLMVALVMAAGPVLSAAQGKNTDEVRSLIEKKFEQEGLLIGNDIHVTVENQTITLSGTVQTLALKEQAGRDAQSVAKGFKVLNNLVPANPGLSSPLVAETLMTAIEKSPDYFIFDFVAVGVNPQGEVTLKGWASFMKSADEFVKLAESQPGVLKIKNEIQRIMITDDDRTLRTRVAELIYKHPIGPSFSRMNGPIHILVERGVVTLVGTVARESDATEIENMVRTRSEAISVVNMLRVRKK